MRRIAPAIALALAGCSSAPPRPLPPSPALPAADLRTQTADQQAVHALSRLTFGARPGDLEAVHAMGVDRWIDRQLHPERIND